MNAGRLPPLPSLAEGEEPPSRAAHGRGRAWEIGILEELDFDLIKVSLKAFDVPTTVAAYRALATRDALSAAPGHHRGRHAPQRRHPQRRRHRHPALAEGIGDTIRVSLHRRPDGGDTGLLRHSQGLNLRQRGPTLIACPTCGRIEVDLIALVEEVEEHFKRLGKPIKVAVMGCVVNGPGEARDADVGIAGGKGNGVIFRRGEVVRTVARPSSWRRSSKRANASSRRCRRPSRSAA